MKMPTQAERLGIVETKVQHIDEKLDDLKADVKEMHDCLDRTRECLDGKLSEMLEEYRKNRDKFYDHANKLHQDEKDEHKALTAKIEELEKFKNKWVYMVLGGVAVLGWVSGHLETIVKFLS